MLFLTYWSGKTKQFKSTNPSTIRIPSELYYRTSQDIFYFIFTCVIWRSTFFKEKKYYISEQYISVHCARNLYGVTQSRVARCRHFRRRTTTLKCDCQCNFICVFTGLEQIKTWRYWQESLETWLLRSWRLLSAL